MFWYIFGTLMAGVWGLLLIVNGIACASTNTESALTQSEKDDPDFVKLFYFLRGASIVIGGPVGIILLCVCAALVFSWQPPT